MKPGGLSFEQAPPFSVPLRFFLTAPAFAVLAALVALWQGAEVFDSRWSPATLAVTHLLTLGCATMAMAGATLQIMPVLAGAPIAQPRRIAFLVHAGLSLGTLSLAGGFLFGEPVLLKSAAVLLAAAFTVFVAAVVTSLARAPLANTAIGMLWLAIISLAITATLGLWLTASRGWGIALPASAMRNLHPAWGLLGWTGLLIMAVANRVVPMFQMTPAYPAWMSRRLGVAVFALLAAWSIAAWVEAGVVARGGTALLAALYVLFAATTLGLQQRRLRRLPNATLSFWRVGMLCAIVAALLWTGASMLAEPPSALAVLLGVLAIVGAALSLINGMLYKIAPFLAWFHLQAQGGAGRQVPHVKQYLADSKQRRQWWLHLAALALMIAATVWPAAFARAAALLFGASALQLFANLVAIAREYRRQLGLLAAAR
jgi:hypothetical protein